jgi:hypothetical protein
MGRLGRATCTLDFCHRLLHKIRVYSPNIYTVPEKFYGNCFDMFASLDTVSDSKKIEKILIIIVQEKRI